MHANYKQLHIGICNGCENSESVIACNYAARSGSPHLWNVANNRNNYVIVIDICATDFCDPLYSDVKGLRSDVQTFLAWILSFLPKTMCEIQPAACGYHIGIRGGIMAEDNPPPHVEAMPPRAHWAARHNIVSSICKICCWAWFQILGDLRCTYSRQTLPKISSGWKKSFPFSRMNPSELSHNMGCWRLVTTTQWQSARTSTTLQMEYELEWQYKLQTRVQKPGKQLADFAGAFRVLAYPAWSAQQWHKILRGQFVQGIHSSSVQLWLIRELLRTMDEALCITNQQETEYCTTRK